MFFERADRNGLLGEPHAIGLRPVHTAVDFVDSRRMLGPRCIQCALMEFMTVEATDNERHWSGALPAMSGRTQAVRQDRLQQEEFDER